MIVKIAFRNLYGNPSRNLMVGLLICFCSFLIFAGTSFLKTASSFLSENYKEHITGDIIIQPETGNGLKGLDRSMADPLIEDYPALDSLLSQTEGVSRYMGQLSGMVTLSFGEKGNAYAIARGVLPEDYQAVFPHNWHLESGTFPDSGGPGFLIARAVAESIEQELGITLQPGDRMTLSYAGKQGVKIRTLPLTGILSYRTPSLEKQGICLVDSTTLLTLMGYGRAMQEAAVLNDQETADLLEGDFFSSALMTSDPAGFSEKKTPGLEQLLNPAGGPSEEWRIQRDQWHYALVKLEDPRQTSAAIARLNQSFLERGWNLTASDWEVAAGSMAQFSRTFQVLFNIVMFLLTVITIFVITNTLVVSVIGRTGEIGTMRAIGSHKSFIRKLFLLETMILAAVSGGLGILLGMGAVGLASRIGIGLRNDLLILMMGASRLHPRLQGISFSLTAVYTLLVGFLSSLYPVQMALRVSPLTAIQE
jgi:putative ABC transport system permease protein